MACFLKFSGCTASLYACEAADVLRWYSALESSAWTFIDDNLLTFLSCSFFASIKFCSAFL